MNCSEFRNQHCAFIDDTLAGVELVRMQRHLVECAACARQDTKVRRALMVARSLPCIELSDGFSARLEAKLRECRERPESATYGSFKVVAGVGLAASLVMMAYVARSLDDIAQPRDLMLPPVVAMAEPPEVQALSPMAPAIVASVSTGMPLWPAALLAEQMQLHVVNVRESHQ